ncbi:hypothetical protein [Pectinatus brassicae]|uniref:Uncharacterized protein n=1 Tax=Pectinatus brassicae TaxID=862415 RepID=A0A840UBQ7_9FIRM|nr:hypothetical protein [Pectinatus brassicae]MBB5335161.1 hypothetical protein [Pectinatus brassicae]
MNMDFFKKVVSVREGLILIVLISFLHDMDFSNMHLFDILVLVVTTVWLILLAKKINKAYKKEKQDK